MSYDPGSFCWAGLATSDPAGARRFYADLFGWEAETLPASCTLLRSNGEDVAILYEQMPQARAAGDAPHWTCFVSVADADATAARAAELGGATVFGEPFDVPGAGRVAAIRDPTGAIVSLWQPAVRIGGAPCWNELATPDVERAMSFYGELLGWEYDTQAGGSSTIVSAGRPNGGIREQATHERGSPPHWIPYFAVDDVEAAARRATAAGGSRRAAMRLADPQGAEFFVYRGETHLSRRRGAEIVGP